MILGLFKIDKIALFSYKIVSASEIIKCLGQSNCWVISLSSLNEQAENDWEKIIIKMIILYIMLKLIIK